MVHLAIGILGKEYVTAARSRGFSKTRVVVRHVVRGTLNPVVTVIGLMTGLLLSSAVVVEFVFTWPGLGSLVTQAVQFRDFSLIQALVIVGALVFVVITLVVDALYLLIDPRVRS